MSQQRRGVHGSRTASRFAMALFIGLSGCGGSSSAMAPPATPAPATSAVSSGRFIETKAFTYDLPVQIAAEADITGAPIHIWVERTSSSASDVVAIKVTGHADEDTCAAVSGMLVDFLTDDKNVDGFLHFGVGEFHAAVGATEFQSKAKKLLEDLGAIQATHGDKVKIDNVAFAPGTRDAPSGGGASRVAILRYRKPSEGPAFIPARTWSPGGPA